ncbi:restriction endonuclease subunit S [Leucobacter ruminantium]|uniref:Restriction endonuclease subunit S n=1 Tax=Leucobacter ruminantium TaxID=1289170 RepID=A0A939M370_9MICO|nr:restriction endonuclease subunit S [Leucobacter ruminantium]MBO1806145.1 restriction endonuclease subunit S [Leucobacter ruminantium]
MTLGEAFDLNPTVKLTKGMSAPFVDMASLVPFTRDVSATQDKPYGGGMKFCDGDVLMARITPSLENGKTSIYRAAVDRQGTPAFGSTEFIVIRGKEGISSTDFAYYLFTSPEIRDHAISSMNGSSGRQRVQLDSLSSFEIDLPELKEQRAIAATLGALDDKIESNRRAISLLDRLFSAQFSRLLESSRSISNLPLSDVATITRGRSYKSAELSESPVALVTLKSIDRNGGYKQDGLKPYVGPYKTEQVVAPGEIVVAQTDLTQGAEVVGRGVRVPISEAHNTLVASLDLAILRPKDTMPVEYLLGLLSSESFRQHCRNHVTGTTVLHLAKDAMPTWMAPVVSAAEQEAFSSVARGLLARVDSFSSENQRLTELRDALLPELLSGRIRVADVEVP